MKFYVHTLKTLLVLSFVLSSCTEISPVHLRFDENYTLDYLVKNDTIPAYNREIQFNITGKGLTGWMGVGFNLNVSHMIGADLYIGGYSPFGQYGAEYKGVTNGPPIRDSSQDWILAYANESKDNSTNINSTEIRLRRKLYTGDFNDIAITDRTMYLLWAYNKDNDSIEAKHTAKGYCMINFANGTTTCSKSGGKLSGDIAVIFFFVSVVTSVWMPK